MAVKFLLSPSETQLADKLGDEAVNSSLCEEKGADILLYTNAGLFKWQRKEVPSDFLLSVTDGRFARLLPVLIKECAYFRLICEGQFKYWSDGTVYMGKRHNGERIPSHFTKKGVHGILNDLEITWDVRIRWTEDIDDTVMYLRAVRDYMTAGKHLGLYTKPKVQGVWAVPTSKELEMWILQSWPGIGPSSADAIIQHFNGKIPLKWSCSYEELAGVAGIGKSKAIEMWNSLPSEYHIAPIIKGAIKKTLTAQPTEAHVAHAAAFDSLRNKLKR